MKIAVLDRAAVGPHRVPVLLGTQLAFNLGFYAVVPFLSLVLSGDFGLAASAVGLVLGIRTLAQQGMFLLGGVLADRFGSRGIIVVGCAVRAGGFFTLAASLWGDARVLPLFIVGTVLTGLGGALFSPGLQILVAEANASRRTKGAARASLFAWLNVTGEIGAVTGPLLGAALFGWGFATVAAVGAAFFGLIGVGLWWALPTARQCCTGPRPARQTPWAALRERRFVAFACLHATDLLAYNQLYLMFPLALARGSESVGVVGLLFVWVSVLTLALQVPISRWGAVLGARRSLRLGYACSASGFALVAVAGEGTEVLFGAVTLMMVGHMCVNPTALGLVPHFAGGRPTGSFFGLLATCGGVAVLGGNVVVGALATHAGQGWMAWAGLAIPLVLASAIVPKLLLRDDLKYT